MPLPLSAFVKFAQYTWETGKNLIDAEVTLGSAEKSSSCKVTISDLDHKVAEAVINHSIKAGGIEQLEGSDKAKTPNIPGSKPELGTGLGVTAGWSSPEEHAFADAVVLRETQAAKDGNIPKSYLAKNDGGVDYTLADFAKGFPADARARKQNIGRYQVNSGDYDEVVAVGLIKDFLPVSQDIIARFKLNKRNRGGKQLLAGDIDAAFKQASNEWVSLPWNTKDGQVQTGTTKKEYVDYYNQQLAAYKGGAATASPKSKVVEAATPASPAKTDTTKPVIKGSVIEVNINGISFEFFHQGTEMTDDGRTVLTGQGLRWLMARRARSRTVKDISLKTLATQVAKQHKVTLEYNATVDPTYSHLDQSGISDYALLIREAEMSGLMVSEDMKKKTLVVKDRAALGTPVYKLQRGVNLISYKITDKALSGQEEDISANLPKTNKVVIDPITGSHVSTKKDVDRLAGANTPTGKVKPKVGGTTTTGDSVASGMSSAKTKRIAGLPSTFVVPLSIDTLVFSPLTTMLTEGFPGCLDRIWVVKTVTHSVANATSTLVLNSPVEVKDNGQPKPPGAKPDGVIPAGDGWVYPTTGTVTSLQLANRNGRPHRGVDIAGGDGTPIYAADAGIISRNEFQASGAGNWVQVKHANGYFTNYFHMIAPSPLGVGTNVKQGDQIGQQGNTGGSRGTHLHFELTQSSSGGHVQVSNTFPKLAKVMNSIIALTPVKNS